MGEILDPGQLAALSEPEHVTVFRLAPPRGYRLPFGLYHIVGVPVEVGAIMAKRLSTTLADTASYDWASISMCLPRPGVMVRFSKGSESIDLYLCFECRMAIVDDPHGAIAGSIMFRPGPIDAEVKQIFPTDAAIQAIPSE